MKNFQNFSITDYFRIIWRRKWYMVLPGVLISAGACIYAWRAPATYRSETTIQVTNRMLPEETIGSIVRESVTDRIEFVRQQIVSRTFVERIVQDLQIAGGSNSDSVISNVSNGIEFTLLPPNTFKLAYVATEPSSAQAVVRRLAERVMQLNEDIRKKIVDTAGQFFDEQLQQTEIDVSQEEGKLKSFSDRNFRGLPAQIDVNSIAELQRQLTAIENDLGGLTQSRSAIELRLKEQNDLKLAGAAAAPQPTPRSAPTRTVETPPAVPVRSEKEKKLDKKNDALADLLGRYGEAYPDVEKARMEIRELEAQVKEEHELQARQPKVPSSPPPLEAVQIDVPSLVPQPELDTIADITQAELKFEYENLTRAIAAKDREKRDISGQIIQFQRRLNLPPALAQEMGEIERNLKAARDRYNLLLSKKVSFELGGKVDTDTNNETFKIIDAANLPQIPFGPKRLQNAALGILTGLLVGCGLVFAREYADTTLLDEEDVFLQLRLPVLTSVPVVRIQKERKQSSRPMKSIGLDLDPAKVIDIERARTGAARLDSIEFTEKLPSPIGNFSLANIDSKVMSVIRGHQTIAGEQYRVMRTLLSLMRKKRDKFQTILISSTIPSEGKTFTSCTIAGVLAQETGKRVLLIDADMRTARASKMLGLAPGSCGTGLCKILTGDARVEESLMKCVDLNLYFLPAGQSEEDPTALMSEAGLEKMIRRCEELFDWVIVDSPPIIGLADAKILATVCDTVLLVVRAEKTPAKLVKDSILRIGNDHICGVLVNGVRNIASAPYYERYYKNQVRNT